MSRPGEGSWGLLWGLDTFFRSSSAIRLAVVWVSAGRVVPGEGRVGHVSRPRAGSRGLSPDLDTAARSSRPTRSAESGFRWSSQCPATKEPGTTVETPSGRQWLRPVGGLLRRAPTLNQRLWGSVGRVVPREVRAGHVSRPPASPLGPSPDLDTPPRSSSATRSAEREFRRSSGARGSAGRVVPRDEGAVVPLVE